MLFPPEHTQHKNSLIRAFQDEFSAGSVGNTKKDSPDQFINGGTLTKINKKGLTSLETTSETLGRH